MTRGRIAIALLVALAALLVLNTFGTGNETEQARVNVEGAEVMRLGGGSAQVLDEAPTGPAGDRGIPVVVLHCYTCSMRWFDLLAPLLGERHRVVRIDLLGHGGSEKPAEGYEIDAQADIVAEALGRLGVEGALVVGHALGANVTTAMAQRHSELVDRVGLIGIGAESGQSSLPLVGEISRAPVIGEALWRITPDFVRRSGLSDAFAPGFDTANGFEDADQPVDDLKAMTYNAYDSWPSASSDWTDELGVARRIAGANVPALVILGAEDQIVDSEAAAESFRSITPATRVRVLEGVGHSPNVEAPEETAAMLESFARRAEVTLGGSGKRQR